MSRLPLLAATALVAAAVADPIVESLSNSGIFGAGYNDDNHMGVVPALLLGTLFVLAILACRCSTLWRRATVAASGRSATASTAEGSTDRRRDEVVRSARNGAWFLETARSASTLRVRDFPLVFPLQLVALFLLESTEQLMAGGGLSYDPAWLGGPALFSLSAHALAGIGCVILLGRLMRAVVAAFASLLWSALRFIWLARRTGATDGFRSRQREMPSHPRPPQSRQIGGRAPPRPAFA